MSQPTVQILLATYNGEKFLSQQLDSLLNQTYQDFTVLIRDDNSTDNTLEIINAYQKKFPQKITLINDALGNIGVAQNFNVLLQNSTADYISFCDQDDIWLENKLEISLAEIKKLENENTVSPCLVYSDMQIINEKNEIISSSLWQSYKTLEKYFVLNRLLIYNIPFGCTVLINKAMANLAMPIPGNAILHDHWLALIAVTIGKYKAISTPLMSLRNHTSNVTRAKSGFFEKLNNAIKNAVTKRQHAYWLTIRVAQANSFKERYQNKLNEEQLKTITNFIALEATTGIKRKWMYVKNKFYKPHVLQTIKMILKA